MSIGIIENINSSFDFAKMRLFGHWLDWVVLITLSLIPIIGWVLLIGFITRVCRGGEAKLGEWIKMLSDGILMCIINIVYFFVLGAVLFIVYKQRDLIPQMATGQSMGAVWIVGMTITLIVAFIFGILGLMAVVRFAKKESLRAAFQLGEIFKTIGKIGWVHYILSLITLTIILCVIVAILISIPIICLAIFNLPIICLAIFRTLFLILNPLITIWTVRFLAQLYESA